MKYKIPAIPLIPFILLCFMVGFFKAILFLVLYCFLYGFISGIIKYIKEFRFIRKIEKEILK